MIKHYYKPENLPVIPLMYKGYMFKQNAKTGLFVCTHSKTKHILESEVTTSNITSVKKRIDIVVQLTNEIRMNKVFCPI